MANFGAVKRKLEPVSLTNNHIVIEISSDEDEVTTVPPPAKRHKSATPILNGRPTRTPSRDASHERKGRIPSTPDSSRVVDISQPIIKKSPFKKLSRFSFPNSDIDKPSAPPPVPKQRHSSPSNGRQSHGNEKSLGQRQFQRNLGINTSRSQLLRNGFNITASVTGATTSSRASQHSKPDRSLSIPESSGRHISVDIRTRKTPVPQATHPRASTSTQDTLTLPQKQKDNVNSQKHNNAQRDKHVLQAANPRPNTHDLANASIRPRPKVRDSPSPLPKPSYQMQTPTPSQSNIEVIIPNLLKQWTAPLPKSAWILKAERKAEKTALLNDLKISAEHAKQRPKEVRRLFGQTGFSESFSTDEDLTARRKLASKKKKGPPTRTDQQLDIDHDLIESFDNLIISNTSIITPEQSSRVLLTNRFNEKVDPPLTFANNVNEQLLNGKFQFTDRYIIRSGIKAAPSSTNYGCMCVVNCGVDSCKCFSKEVPDEGGKGVHIEQRQTYLRRPDGLAVLTDDYMARELDPVAKHFEITECNEFCSCGPNCWNRVVSKGRTVPLEIFQTAKCGFGVRSSVDIVKGQFIELYLGEVITEAELQRREDAVEEGESSYIYSLDWFTGVENRTGYHVDGQYFGTAMRFVNHSCKPNARCFTVQTHKQDKKLYYLAFFAIENIPKEIEIRIDYSGGASVFGEDEEDRPAQVEGEMSECLVRCHCGEKNCRKYLWNPAVKARRWRRRRRGE